MSEWVRFLSRSLAVSDPILEDNGALEYSIIIGGLLLLMGSAC